MTLLDVILCLFIPPLASGVRARGCGTMAFVGLLWLCLWIPGSIAAFVISMSDKPQQVQEVHIHHYDQPGKPDDK